MVLSSQLVSSSRKALNELSGIVGLTEPDKEQQRGSVLGHKGQSPAALRFSGVSVDVIRPLGKREMQIALLFLREGMDEITIAAEKLRAMAIVAANPVREFIKDESTGPRNRRHDDRR